MTGGPGGGSAGGGGAGGSRPRWPDGLADDTALPYRLWRILNLVDGRRSAAEIGSLLGLGAAEVQGGLEEAAAWVGRAAQREQRVDEAAAQVVTQCLSAVVGPVASLMVDEVLDDLGGRGTLSALLSGLAEQLSPERLQLFARHLRERGLA